MTAPRFPLPQSHPSKRRQHGALGLFQLLGLGLILMFLLFLLIVVIRGLFTAP